MKIRHNVSELEFNSMREWWRHRGQQIPKFEFLPKHSFSVCEDSELVEDQFQLAVWYYVDYESKTIIPDWLISNPENSLGTLLKAVALMSDELEEICNAAGLKVIRCFTWSPTIAKYAERFGFEFEPNPVYHYGKLIK